ncbi:Nuclear transport factor 2 [Dimargaris cristalligena]|uniref:Nuclear transport factor 2 n=1 Tax=Dimargaris cristalligena TaxID=215637 RepID=A0A4P9ZQ44_9FUNG|nr:Nuclear transport factor 2 [Dimargaris cristalligena]RKP35375.1 nuclear transport factor 2 [Dimargaris cristalligena]|eukprot:RKP35375.1 nuclear transport factor 2 [Dimargaris cristalligena]
MADINTVAKQFTDYYYSTFDNNRAQLANLYKDVSMLTFEGTPILGGNSITEKLVSLPFQKVAHQVSTLDAQPSNPTTGSILVNVTGKLLIDEEQNPQQFSQTFNLIPEGGSYWVYNDIFRLNYG